MRPKEQAIARYKILTERTLSRNDDITFMWTSLTLAVFPPIDGGGEEMLAWV